MTDREVSFKIEFEGNAKDLIKTNESIDDLIDKAEVTGKGLDDIKSKGKESFDPIEKNSRKAGDAVKEMTKKLDGASKGLSSISDKFGNIGTKLSLGITTPLTLLGKKSFNLFNDFSAEMSEVAAISSASTDEIEKLTKVAREMGATTQFSASDAASALKFMAQSGWDTNKMVSGLPGVIKLAAASGEDLALSSSILTGTMTAFGMSADKSARFADVLAQAANASNTGVAEMGETFKYAAPIAGSLGYSIEDVAIATGLMANANIKGGQAGTTLRAALTNLVKPTKDMQSAMDRYGISLTDSQGKMLPFMDVMENIRSGLGGLSEAEQANAAATLFGQQAMSGMLAIVNTSERDFNNLADAIYNSVGASDAVAKIMNDNIKGDFAELSSGIEEVALSIGDLLEPKIRSVIQNLTQFVAKFNSLDDCTKLTIIKFAGIAASLGPLAVGFSGVTGVMSKVTSGLSVLSETKAGEAILKNSDNIKTAIKGFDLKSIKAINPKAFFRSFKDGIAGVGKSIMGIGPMIQKKGGILGALKGGGKGALSGIGTAIKGGLAGIVSMGATILPIIVVVTLLGAAIFAVVKNWDKVKAAGVDMADKLQPKLSACKDFAGQTFQNVGGFLSNLADKFAGFGPVVGQIITNVIEIISFLAPVFATVFSGIGFALGITIDTIGNLISRALGIFQGFTDFLVGIFTLDFDRAIKGVGTIFKNVFGGFGDIIKGVADLLGGFIGKIGKAGSKLLGLNKNAAGTSALSGVAASAPAPRTGRGSGGGIPAFAGGVKNFGGGLALVGEKGPELVTLPRGSDVLPADETKSLISPLNSITTAIYNNSTTNNTSTKNGGKVGNFDITLNIYTNSDKPQEIASASKNALRELFAEIIDENLATT